MVSLVVVAIGVILIAIAVRDNLEQVINEFKNIGQGVNAPTGLPPSTGSWASNQPPLPPGAQAHINQNTSFV
jgi:hypothetical protein